MTKRLEPATEVMGPDAGLHPDQTGRHIGQARFNLTTRPSLLQRNRPAPIQANDVKRILPISMPTTATALFTVSAMACSFFGVPASLIAGGAGARPDHPISGSRRTDAQPLVRAVAMCLGKLYLIPTTYPPKP